MWKCLKVGHDSFWFDVGVFPRLEELIENTGTMD